MSDLLEVEPRTTVGTRANYKLRATGSVPAVLYGHKETPVNLTISIDKLRPVLRHGAKVVDLKGGADGQAVVQDLQWDTFGRQLLHVDLLRVSADEKIHVTVPIELKGEAPGSFDGGVVELTLREVEIEATPASIPERLHIDVSELHQGGSMNASDIIDLPPGCALITPADKMAVHCVTPLADDDETADPAAADEPEVVGKKDEEASEG